MGSEGQGPHHLSVPLRASRLPLQHYVPNSCSFPSPQILPTPSAPTTFTPEKSDS